MNDILQLAWSDESGNKHIIGELNKTNEKYVFKYDSEGVKKAYEYGFQPLISFPSLNAIYENRLLFPVFSSRLPDRRRSDIGKILDMYQLTAYEPFELLKSSGGKLPTDKFEFIALET